MSGREHATTWCSVGAGGAGAAVGYAMLKLGSRSLTVHDMDGTRTAALVDQNVRTVSRSQHQRVPRSSAALAKANGLIHATPTGMRKHPGIPVPAESLRPPLWVSEIVYVPLLTELVLTARKHGCRTLDGGGMAVYPGRDGIQSCSSTWSLTSRACCDDSIPDSRLSLRRTHAYPRSPRHQPEHVRQAGGQRVRHDDAGRDRCSRCSSSRRSSAPSSSAFRPTAKPKICERIHRVVIEKNMAAVHDQRGRMDALQLRSARRARHAHGAHRRSAYVQHPRARSVPHALGHRPIAKGQICGFGIESYLLALRAAVSLARQKPAN